MVIPVAPCSAGTWWPAPQGTTGALSSSKHSTGVSDPLAPRWKWTRPPLNRDAAYTSLPLGLTATGRVPVASPSVAGPAPHGWGPPVATKHSRKARLPIRAAEAGAAARVAVVAATA